MKCDGCFYKTICTYDTARAILQKNIDIACEGYQAHTNYVKYNQIVLKKEEEMKTIKIANGVRLTTTETVDYPDMTIFDVIKCTEEQKIEIIRNLMGYHRIDLTEALGYIFIMELY